MGSAIDLPAIINDISNGAYPVLGSGSGRRVYDLRNGTVLKAAKNKKGYAQNQIESIISEMDDSDLFAKVLFISPDNRFLIMEKADPVTDFSYVRNYFHVKNNPPITDLCRPVNWGILHDRPVIIDYGFTGRIRRKYYSVF